jgi:hypothetical protein
MYAQVMGLGTCFAGLGEKAKNLLSAFSGIFSGFSVRSRIKINSKVLIIAVVAIMVIVALLLVLTIVSHPGKGESKSESTISDYANEPLKRDSTPADEFFLPYEPDFVPDVLLEREPKESWTEEDARPFWTDPLEGNEDVWRKRVESGVDSMLENVP